MTAARTAVAVIADLIDDLDEGHPAEAQCREALTCLAHADLTETPNMGLAELQTVKPLRHRAFAASRLVRRLRPNETDPLILAQLTLAEAALLYAAVLLALPIEERN